MKILIGLGGGNDSDVKVIRGYNDFFIDEDSKQLQRISWICVGRYYCATTPSRKNAKLQTVLLVRVNESGKEQCLNNIT